MLDQENLSAGAGLTFRADGRGTSRSGIVAVFTFSLAIFASAFLLFLLQPLVGKYILPWFGGSAAVWTTCMLFFQVLLLGGYAYAHGSIRLLRPRTQVIVHTILLAAALAALPITPAAHWKPAGTENPAGRILILLSVSVGLPYFVLSATAPLLQAWFSRVSGGRSPYRLYALSNAASLMSLLGYPFIFEPLFSRTAQARLWGWGLAGFAACYALCAMLMFRLDGEIARPDEPQAAEGERRGSWILWLLLPACASALLLATNNKMCQDIAVVPFLWVLPLSLYLITFIIAFDSPRWYFRPVWISVMAIAMGGLLLMLWNDQSMLRPVWDLFERRLPLTWMNALRGERIPFRWIRMLLSERTPITWQIGFYSAAMFSCCMVCHGELSALRPHPRRLTAFYLCIAAGGALGGVAVALLAPMLLSGYYELHLAVFACCALLVAALLADPSSLLYRGRKLLPWSGAVMLLVVLGVALYMPAVKPLPGTTKIAQQRNFYGTLSVCEENADNPAWHSRLLNHGAITHGLQYLHPDKRREATTYFVPDSGIGMLLQILRPQLPRHVGIVGLGTGTLSAYGKRGDTFRFYELNAGVEHMARTYFSFLADSQAQVTVVLGDARLSLEREATQEFDIFAIDAFSGDAIPAHLLTRESMELYLRHMKSDGVIAVHITNRYLDLEPVVSALADEMKLQAWVCRYAAERPGEGYPSDWVLLSRGGLLEPSMFGGEIEPLPRAERRPLWTDDHTSLFSILK